MDVSYPPEAEAFRDRIREFVAEHLPPGWPGPGALPPHEREEFARHWRRALAGAGLVAVSWPTEYGGGGLSPMEQVVLAEEFARAGAPERAENDLLGIDLLGNTLIALGSEAQKRHFLPRILSGEHRWCQGFSEPEAGSDLASVRTRGVLDGDEWVINGHKIWTSAGTTANWIFLLARTDPSAAKHRGLSFLLVPMDQPGVVVRPIVNAAGHSSFSEVFLTDARTSAGNVVGRVGDGWSTAMTLLGFERGSHIATAAIDFERDLQRLCELARDRGLHTDPRVRDGLAWCYARVQIMRYRGYRDLTLALTGRPPGAEAAITKVIWSEYFRRYTDLAVEILGLEALGPRGPGNGGARLVPEAGTPNSPACWMDELLLRTGRDDLCRQLADPAQRDRRAAARPPQGAAARSALLTWTSDTAPNKTISAPRCAASLAGARPCGRWLPRTDPTAGCGNGFAPSSNYPRCTSRRSTADWVPP